MAVIDSVAGEIVIRLVYDGPPEAGKTTSLRALAGSLTRPAHSPAEDENGRTLWFDWMEYVGGRFEGSQIRCQIVSVAGQRELTARRRRVIAGADVVVFVADSAARELPTTVTYLDELRSMLAGVRPAVGVILQANKRDLPDASPLSELRGALAKLGWPVGVVESVAATGTGIRETFVYAVRLALDRVRELLAGGPVTAGTAGTADDLLAALRADEAAAKAAKAPPRKPPALPSIDFAELDAPEPDPADDIDADDIDFAAIDAIDADAAAAADAADIGAVIIDAELGPPILATDSHSLAAELFRDVLASENPLMPDAGDDAFRFSAVAVPATATTLDAAALDVMAPDAVSPAVSEIEAAEIEAAEIEAAEIEAPPVPAITASLPTVAPLPPTPAVPSGAIWPPVEGRAILQELSTLDLSPRRLSTGDWIAGLGSGWRVMSNRDAVFATLDDGRAALIQWARLHSSATEILSAPRCIVLADDGKGAWRLWQLVRALPSLREAVDLVLHESESRDAMISALRRIAQCLVEADGRLSSLPIRLPCTLDNLGTSDLGVVYIGLMPSAATPLLEPRPRRDSRNVIYSTLEPIIGRDLQDHHVELDDLLSRPTFPSLAVAAPHAVPSVPVSPGITTPLPAIPAPKPINGAAPASITASTASSTTSDNASSGTPDGIARAISTLLGA